MHTPAKLIALENRLEDSEHRVIVPCVQSYDIKSTAFGSGVLAAEDDGGAANAKRLALCWNMHDDLVKFVQSIADVWPIFQTGAEMPMGVSMSAHEANELIKRITQAP